MSKWTSPTKRRKKLLLNCERKVRHPSFEAAQAALAEVATVGKLSGIDVTVYKCEVCGFYHWGRTPSGGSNDRPAFAAARE